MFDPINEEFYHDDDQNIRNQDPQVVCNEKGDSRYKYIRKGDLKNIYFMKYLPFFCQMMICNEKGDSRYKYIRKGDLKIYFMKNLPLF